MPDATSAAPGSFQALLIDWAGTITVPMHEMILTAATALGFDEEATSQAVGGLAAYYLTEDSPIHRAEVGTLDDDDLREFLEEKAPGAGRLLDPEGPSFLNGADRPEMIALLEDLRDVDVTVVLATNNFKMGHELLATRYLDSGLVSAVVNSAMVGVRKPDLDFYQLCLDVAGCDANEALFVDDQERNLASARELGMGALLVEDNADHALSELRRLFL